MSINDILMANIFTKVLDNAVGRYVAKQTVRLTSPNSGLLRYFGSYWNYDISGYSLTKFIDAYSSNPYVYNIINKIAKTSAAMGRNAVTTNDKEVVDSRLLELLTEEKRQQINENLLSTGNAFLYLVKGVGAGEDIDIWNVNCVQIFCNTIGEIVKIEYTTPWDRVLKIQGDDLKKVLHIKTSNIVSCQGSSTKWGLSPLQAAWIIVESSNEKFKAEASIFKNRGAIGLLSNNSEIPMLPDERDLQQNQLNSQIGGADNFNKINISTANLKFVQLGMSPTDLKLLEGLVSSLRILCSVYGISSVLFNDNDNSTYNNISEAKTSAYNEVYIPLARNVDKQVSEWLAPLLGVDEKIIVDLNAIDEIKLSTNDIAQALGNLSTQAQERVLEVMSVEEARQLIELGVLGAGAELLGKKTDRPDGEGA